MQEATDRRTVVGVFSDDTTVQNAVTALHQGGFEHDAVSIEGGRQRSPDLVAALVSMGIEHDRAQAYDEARLAGSTLVIVAADGREAEAQRILREFELPTTRSQPVSGDDSAAILTIDSMPVTG